MSEHPDLAPLLAARSLGLLEPEGAGRLDAHLAACAPCRELAASASPAVSGAPAPAAWERLRARLEAGVVVDPAPAPVEALTAATTTTTTTTVLAAPIKVSVPGAIRVACSFCHGGLERGEAVYCAACLAAHHLECFREHARCSVAGCGGVEIVRPARPDDLVERPRPTPRWRRWRVLEGLGARIPVLLGAAACAWGLLVWDWTRAQDEHRVHVALAADARELSARVLADIAATTSAREEALRLHERSMRYREVLAGRTMPLTVLRALGEALPTTGPDLLALPAQAARSSSPAEALAAYDALVREQRLEERKLWLLGLRLRPRPGDPRRHELELVAAKVLDALGRERLHRGQADSILAARDAVEVELAHPLGTRLDAAGLNVRELELGAPALIHQLHAACTASPGPARELTSARVPVRVVLDAPGEER